MNEIQIAFGLIIPALVSILVGIFVYIVSDRNSNSVIDRLKKNRHSNQRSIIDDLLEFIKPMTEANLKSSKGKNKVRQMLIKLGKPVADSDIMDFENKRMLSLLIVGACAILFAITVATLFEDSSTRLVVGAILICMPSYIVYKRPIWNLSRQIKAKEKAFEKYFPDAIDLLCVCVEAGLSIDSAIERVGREFSNFSKDVGSEFGRVAKDMLSGVSKQEALKGLAERVDNKDIQSFVAIIVQSDKMGSSISTSLAVSADSIRTRRRQRLEALVAAASAKMTIPLVFCVLLPTVLIIIIPVLIQVMESLKKYAI